MGKGRTIQRTESDFPTSRRPKRAVRHRLVSFFSLLVLVGASLVTIAVAGPSPSPAHASTVNGFVTKSGSTLQLNGSPFRFAGANMYWLGLDENVGGVAYPTQYRVNDALTTAREMGATVVRSHTLGFSAGCALCIEPSLGTFNQVALAQADYAIKTAGENGIRLVLPLVDNWRYYAGGKHTFTDWRGLTNENDFYTNPTVIADFEQYISTVLNHVNVYTGIVNKDNPTILAWEEGNELTNAPSSWMNSIATYIKNIDANHLVAYGTVSQTIDAAALSVPKIDIIDAHYYPMYVGTVNGQAAQVINAGKVFYVGEYGWNGLGGGDTLASFLSAIESNGAAGDTYWSLFPHNDSGGYVQHSDGYTLHYPGDTSSMRTAVGQLRSHAYSMSGIGVPVVGTPGPPLITSIVGGQVTWRGATLGNTYDVERSTTSASTGYSTICAQCVNDNSTPWTDSTQPNGTSWYRIRGYNVSGTAGPYSPNVYEVVSDPLNDWSKSYSHSSNLGFDSSNVVQFGGDPSRARRLSATNESIVWHLAGATSFQASTYFWPSEPVSPFSLMTSADGVTWAAATPTITGGGGSYWYPYTYTLSGMTNTNFVKVVWNNLTGNSWTPQIGRVTLARQVSLTDSLNDLSLVTSASTPLKVDASNSSLFSGDTARANRGLATSNTELVWAQGGVNTFQATTYFWPSEPVSPFSMFTSADGSTWAPATPVVAGGTGNWLEYTYTLSGLTGVNFVKMRWNNTTGQSWSPQISQVTLSDTP